MIKLFLATDLSEAFKDLGDKLFPNVYGLIIQLVCTFVMVLIIAKFLVKPAKKFIKQRHDYIENNLNEATSKNQDAEQALNEANKFLNDSKKISKEMIDTARIEALNEKDKVVLETTKEIKYRQEKAQLDIQNERKKMKEDLQNEIVDVAILAAEKVVDRKITSQDTKKIIDDFLKDDIDNG